MESKTKRRLVRTLFVAALLFVIGSFALWIVSLPLNAKVDQAIEAASTVEELGVVLFSPEYKLAVLLSNLSVGSGVVAGLLFLATFLAWARNRSVLGRNRAPQ